MNKIYHLKLRHMQVLVSFQQTADGVDQPKYVALAKSWNYLNPDGNLSYRQIGSKVKPNYYLLWGNNEDLSYSGFTLLRTPSGRSVTYSSAMKSYKEAVKSTEFISFSNC